MRIKKALSFILAATLLLGLCAGCGKSAGSLYDDAMQAKDGGDAVKTVELLTKAAEKDSAQAMIALGSIYAYDDGVEPDQAKAKELYDLATAYNLGDGVEQDFQKAREYYEQAADLGCEDAAEAMERLDQPAA